MNEKTTWLSHEFTIHEPGATWSHVGAVYLFCGVNQQKNQWIPLYVGQAEDLADRLSTHKRWPEAVRLGATHVHARAVPQQSQRDSLEKQLIQAFQPRLNIQLK